jgi:hypothetical protein
MKNSRREFVEMGFLLSPRNSFWDPEFGGGELHGVLHRHRCDVLAAGGDQQLLDPAGDVQQA